MSAPLSSLEEYIRTNANLYTRAAITENLRAMGHSQEEIDAAWAAVESPAGEPAGSTSPASRPIESDATRRAGTFSLVLLVAAALITTLSWLFLLIIVGAQTVLKPNLWTGVNVVFVAFVIASIFGAVALRRRGMPIWQISALLIVACVVWFFVLWGACFNVVAPYQS